MTVKKRRAKSDKLDAQLAAIEAIEEAARKLEEASDGYEEASRVLMEAAREVRGGCGFARCARGTVKNSEEIS